MQEINAEKESYKTQVAEMKNFLADYGLVWVGKDGAKEGKFNLHSIN